MRKIIKISRYLRAVAQPNSAVPFFWHIGRPNFGDDINPAFFDLLSNQKIRFERNRNRPHFLGMGSILCHATPSSTVLGSGFIQPPSAAFKMPSQVISVRGKLTQSYLDNADNAFLGDPMVLVSLLGPFDKPSEDIVGFVPHISEVNKTKRMSIPGVKIIDPSLSPMRVVNDISSCSRIFSQSLHGLIVADALKVPNIWVAPSFAMMGADFKFRDYFSTMDTMKKPQPFKVDTFMNTPCKDFCVAEYLFDKVDYKEAIVEEMSRLRTP